MKSVKIFSITVDQLVLLLVDWSTQPVLFISVPVRQQLQWTVIFTVLWYWELRCSGLFHSR